MCDYCYHYLYHFNHHIRTNIALTISVSYQRQENQSKAEFTLTLQYIMIYKEILHRDQDHSHCTVIDPIIIIVISAFIIIIIHAFIKYYHYSCFYQNLYHYISSVFIWNDCFYSRYFLCFHLYHYYYRFYHSEYYWYHYDCCYQCQSLSLL